MFSARAIRQERLARSTVALAALAPAVHAQTVVATIPVNYKPLGVGVNILTNEIYVASTLNSEGNVAVINGTTNAVIARIDTGVGTSAFKVAVNSVTNRIYVTNSAGSSVAVIDGRYNTVMTSIGVCGAGNPNHVAVNWWTNIVYVTCQYPSALG